MPTSRQLALQTTDDLLVEYSRDPQPEILDLLTARLLPMARAAAKRYARSGEPNEDLIQVASIGLVNAIKRFDPERGFAFSSLAMPTMLGELRRYFRDRTWSVHVPRGTQERAQHVKKATDQLHEELGRAPSASELAGRLDISVEDVVEAQLAQAGYKSSSYDAPTNVDDENGSLIERIGSDDVEYARTEQRVALDTAARFLDDRERNILRWRYHEELTQAEVAERLGISQMHVSRLQRRAEEQLRERLVADEKPRVVAA